MMDRQELFQMEKKEEINLREDWENSPDKQSFEPWWLDE